VHERGLIPRRLGANSSRDAQHPTATPLDPSWGDE